MSVIYPAGPAQVAPALTAASSVYRRQAWIAMLALLAFGAFYAALTGWFGWKAYTLLRAAVLGSRDPLWVWVGGAGAAFITVFMLKALFFVRRGKLEGLVEVTEQEQPGLFAFLYRLADEARAPRPRKVFLSSRVNAAVFYDLSPLNLLFPSRKNLEIGLALVNVLNLSELKAVLAHEFGHFAQRSMAVGRWVYVAQQIAATLVARRDMLDKFLRGLSSIDIRVSWVGWILSLLVWSIRSLVDTFFRIVLAAERALSREMEFQADRISVSLAGSDALIEALFRLQAADTAWDRAIAFANAEAAKGKLTGDLFEVQSQIMQRLRALLDDAAFGAPPARPATEAAGHRIFRKEMVQPLRMWASHPLNHEREENAKRLYHPAPLDPSSAWTLFRDPAEVRRQGTAAMFPKGEPQLPVATPEETRAALDAEYGRESFKSIYRGCYLARPVTRAAARVDELYAAGPADRNAMYPPSLGALVKDLEALQREQAELQAVQAGRGQATDGEIRFRGRILHRRQLPLALGKVKSELQVVQDKLAAHDSLCRSVGRDLGRAQGRGWDAYVQGLLALLHYAEHMEANLADAHGALANVLGMVTAKRRVSDAERKRLVIVAADLYTLLEVIHRDAVHVQPDAATLQRAGLASWQSALGEWKLGAPSQENLGKWMDVIDSWVQPVQRALGRLRRSTLDQLLVTEAMLARAAYQHQGLDDAPAAPEVPPQYPSFISGSARPRQEKLDWWSRFLTADGWLPGTVRLAVAGGIIASLMGMSSALGTAQVAVHNGLDRAVQVEIGRWKNLPVGPGATQHVDLDLDGAVTIRARTLQGQEIESFRVDPDVPGAQYVYNVAAASPLVEWTAVYGNASASPDAPLGAQRWLSTGAETILQAPPEQIRTKGGGGTRRVISAAPGTSVRAVFQMDPRGTARKDVTLAHARWDDTASASISDWLGLAQGYPEFPRLLAARLAEQPADVVLLRLQQDSAPSQQHEQVCQAQQALAVKNPEQADLQYLAARCQADPAEREAAFQAGYQRHPGNGWFGFAAASGLAEKGEFGPAARGYSTCLKLPALAEQCALELARVRRLQQGSGAELQDLASRYQSVRVAHMFESGAGLQPGSEAEAYPQLARGRVAEAASKAGKGPDAARVLRLAAASDGAPDALAQQASRLPAGAGIDNTTFWPALGLALRRGEDVQPLLAHLQEPGFPPPVQQALQQFVDVLRTSRDVQQAEAAAAQLPVALRAQVYVAGVVALGPKAPAAWREYARRALFVGERPYFALAQ